MACQLGIFSRLLLIVAVNDPMYLRDEEIQSGGKSPDTNTTPQANYPSSASFRLRLLCWAGLTIRRAAAQAPRQVSQRRYAAHDAMLRTRPAHVSPSSALPCLCRAVLHDQQLLSVVVG